MKKFGILLATLAAFTTTFGCWYKFYNYEDYIYAINNKEIHTENIYVADTTTKQIKYDVINNMVVDFPISVSVKLVSKDQVIIGDIGVTNKPEIISCSLQYRVLPNGKWITV